MFSIKRAVGIGAAGLMVLGVAGGIAPAQATHVIVPVCNSLASQIATANTDHLNKTIVAGNANTNVAARLADLNNAQANLITTLVAYVNAVEANSGVAQAEAILNSATQNYVNQAIAYVGAVSARDAANNNVTFALQTLTILSGMAGGLGC